MADIFLYLKFELWTIYNQPLFEQLKSRWVLISDPHFSSIFEWLGAIQLVNGVQYEFKMAS